MRFWNTRYSYNNFSVIYSIGVAALGVNKIKQSYTHFFYQEETGNM
jgi:hypothetical protein